MNHTVELCFVLFSKLPRTEANPLRSASEPSELSLFSEGPENYGWVLHWWSVKNYIWKDK